MRIFRRKVEDNSVPLDMTPMIDCIFLLLIFFILTSKFIPDDLMLAALMPSEGQAKDHKIQPNLDPKICITITPAGAPLGASEKELDAWVKQSRHQGEFAAADVRIGGSDPVRVNLAALSPDKGEVVAAELERVHRHVIGELAQRELGAISRSDAPAVEVHCFSQLPWAFAALAYDAVRAYELQRYAAANADVTKGGARTVNFAPPRIKNFSSLQAGKELWEIQHMK